ncbi:hypothetical protein EJB05_45170 [Eragrostis curvula]|uniref:Uncharacterized protein n=1 Tax=Eragrostis curvula TaxID=38414 RepID=A0A5J9TJH7_9POAL|nr:hypothetical protein EJB05_45170 [Eragrostis curvula]
MSTSDAIVHSSLHGNDAGTEDVGIEAEETGADLNVLECANHQPQGKPRCTTMFNNSLVVLCLIYRVIGRKSSGMETTRYRWVYFMVSHDDDNEFETERRSFMCRLG